MCIVRPCIKHGNSRRLLIRIEGKLKLSSTGPEVDKLLLRGTSFLAKQQGATKWQLPLFWICWNSRHCWMMTEWFELAGLGKACFQGFLKMDGWTQPWPLKLQNLSLSAIILVHSLASKVPRYDSEVVSTLNLCN
ncbi:hypothetical protein CsSME_00004694 [Camellia sinensis var. sinensis]